MKQRSPLDLNKFIHTLVGHVATLGGLVLVCLIILTSISVLGRELNGFAHFLDPYLPSLSRFMMDSGVAAIDGDYEVLEAGVAFAIFAFLPICQFFGGHASVDIFTDKLPEKPQRFLIAFWETILTIMIVIITWRLFAGLVSKYNNNETTFLLQFPLWWSYSASFCAALIGSLVSIYCASISMLEAWKNRSILPRQGAEH